jgi:hypothetical protein
MANSGIAVAVPWSVHNGALKYFRDFVLNGDQPLKILTTDEWVRCCIHGKAQDYNFGDDWVQWDWRTFVAAWSQDDRDLVFEGHAITAVAVGRRPGTYDHNMAIAAKIHGWDDYCTELVDFHFCRGDGRTVLVHPSWKKKKRGFIFVLKPIEPSNDVAIIPKSGRGKSDGKGTYRRVTSAAYSEAAFSPVSASSSAVAAATSSSGAPAAADIGSSAAAVANAASAAAAALWS